MVIKCLSDSHQQGQKVIEFVSQHRQGQMVIKFIAVMYCCYHHTAGNDTSTTTTTTTTIMSRISFLMTNLLLIAATAFLLTQLLLPQECCHILLLPPQHTTSNTTTTLAANVACVVSAESGDMTETYGDIETCRRHVGSIGELLIAKRTYIYLHTNSYVAYIRTKYRHKKFVSPRHACRCQHWRQRRKSATCRRHLQLRQPHTVVISYQGQGTSMAHPDNPPVHSRPL